MSAYVQVPADLSKIKTKVLFNLTLRQLVCFGLGGILSIPVYFLSRELLGTTIAAVLMILIALPFFYLRSMKRTDSRWRWSLCP